MIQLGDKVKDRISGVEGIAIARSEFLYGCVRVGIAPVKPTGKADDHLWFDEPQLEVVKRGAVKGVAGATGGPRPNPTR